MPFPARSNRTPKDEDVSHDGFRCLSLCGHHRQHDRATTYVRAHLLVVTRSVRHLGGHPDVRLAVEDPGGMKSHAKIKPLVPAALWRCYATDVSRR